MDDAAYAEMKDRIDKLEARIRKLEKRQIISEASGGEENLLERFPYMMNKTQAAEVIGVTRATIYHMIDEGRLKENGAGKINTRDVIKLLESEYQRKPRPCAWAPTTQNRKQKGDPR